MQGPEGLFEPIFVTDEMAPITSAQNWVQKMVEFECALAQAQAEVGLIPVQAANEISALISTHEIDATELGVKARSGGTPVIPLVRILTEKLSESARPWIHYGATSQDVLDTATMMIVREAVKLIYADLLQVGALLASLAQQHRRTPMVARTLMQHALPTTFGLKVANWLDGVVSASVPLEHFYAEGLSLQFGGAAGTLAALGDSGIEVGMRVASILGLSLPIIPWHAQRVRIAELGASLSLTVGSLAKISTDITLASQVEIGELREVQDSGGGSSALPQKVNPVGPIVVNACFRRMQGLLPVLYGCLLAENERGAGEWQAEWQTLRDLLLVTGVSVQRTSATLSNLVVDEIKMLQNLELDRGNVMSERILLMLSEVLGRSMAHDLVREATIRTVQNTSTLREELMKESVFRERFSPEDALRLFDPLTYLGSVEVFIDNALAEWKKSESNWQRIVDGTSNTQG